MLLLATLVTVVAWAAYERYWSVAVALTIWWALGTAIALIDIAAMRESQRQGVSQTKGTIETTALQIRSYMRKHRSPPPSLSALPNLESPPKDAWGRKLVYFVDKDGIVTLGSYGADGKPGGKGLDQDLIYRFRTRRPDGSLNVDDNEIHWIGPGPKCPLESDEPRSASPADPLASKPR